MDSQYELVDKYLAPVSKIVLAVLVLAFCCLGEQAKAKKQEYSKKSLSPTNAEKQAFLCQTNLVRLVTLARALLFHSKEPNLCAIARSVPSCSFRTGILKAGLSGNGTQFSWATGQAKPSLLLNHSVIVSIFLGTVDALKVF